MRGEDRPERVHVRDNWTLYKHSKKLVHRLRQTDAERRQARTHQGLCRLVG
jgi:hypothetical protein